MEFLRYVKNDLSPEESYGLMGIATVLLNQNAVSYIIKQNKEGGFYVTPFSQKMNGEWHKSYLIDSNIQDTQVKDFIRENVKKFYDKIGNRDSVPESTNECPF